MVIYLVLLNARDSVVYENNNGFVLSSIFTRDNSRTYVKPIEKLESSYALTTEERQAIEIATK